MATERMKEKRGQLVEGFKATMLLFLLRKHRECTTYSEEWPLLQWG